VPLCAARQHATAVTALAARTDTPSTHTEHFFRNSGIYLLGLCAPAMLYRVGFVCININPYVSLCKKKTKTYCGVSCDVAMSVVGTGGIGSGHVLDGSSASYNASTRPSPLSSWPVTSNDRKRFTDYQLLMLFRHYEHQIYPSVREYNRLASVTGLRREQVIRWFRNHRASLRRRLQSYAL